MMMMVAVEMSRKSVPEWRGSRWGESRSYENLRRRLLHFLSKHHLRQPITRFHHTHHQTHHHQSTPQICAERLPATPAVRPPSTPPHENSHTNIPSDKSTWWGCGSHIPMVMDTIPEDERCICEPKVERDGKAYPPKAKNP